MVSLRTWDVLGQACGWISFFLWSFSFYPQAWENYSLKSVSGFSIEYAFINPLGYLMYSIYNLQGLVDPAIGITGRIDTNDLIFSIHGFALSASQFTQCVIYDQGFQKGKNQRIRQAIAAFICLLIGSICVVFVIEALSPTLISQRWGTIRLCGYSKSAITFVKYMPQVYLNYQRKSTDGFSMPQVFLDFLGGFFSFIQIIINSVAMGKPLFDQSDLGFNIVKFTLSILTICFDLIFMFQHAFLYGPHLKKRKTEPVDQIDSQASDRALLVSQHRPKVKKKDIVMYEAADE